MSIYQKTNPETTEEDEKLIQRLQKEYKADFDDICRYFYNSPAKMEEMLIKQARYRFE